MPEKFINVSYSYGHFKIRTIQHYLKLLTTQKALLQNHLNVIVVNINDTTLPAHFCTLYTALTVALFHSYVK